MDRVERLGEPGGGPGARSPRRSGPPASGRARRCSASLSALVLLVDLVALLAPDLADALQHLRQAGPAVARFRREVGAAPERLAGGRQEHRQRPAALLAEQRQGMLVDLVEIGPLLAIDLDVDEVAVHQRGDRRVLEALVRHHVAPVAGGVADREQDRLVLLPGGGERRLVPRLPVHRVVPVLEQIRAGRFGEAVAHGRIPRLRPRARGRPGGDRATWVACYISWARGRKDQPPRKHEAAGLQRSCHGRHDLRAGDRAGPERDRRDPPVRAGLRRCLPASDENGRRRRRAAPRCAACAIPRAGRRSTRDWCSGFRDRRAPPARTCSSCRCTAAAR